VPNVVEIIVVARDMTSAGFGKAEAKATGLGATLTKFAAVGGLALAAVGVESVRMAAKFDASMEMLSTQAGVPQSKIAGLKSGVLALASQVGFSPDSLSESLYHVASNMASLGATGPQMLNLVKTAAEGAKVGGADLVDVTNAMTAAVASGIPGVKNYQQAMGMLNATVGAGDMKMQDLAEAFGTGMVAVVKGYGLSLKDVGAALATFGDNNIRGAKAGTDLRMAVQALAVPAGSAKKVLEGMGMSMTQMAGDMQHGGLLPALKDLQEHLRKAGVTAKQQGQDITAIFGKKAGAGVAVLLGQMDRLESKYPAITKGAGSFGDAWQKTLAQTSTVFSQLKGWAEALMISIGEKLLPVVKSFGQFMLNNKTAIEVTLGVVAALVAVLGTYVTVVKTVVLVTKIWEAVQAILNGEMTMNPIGLVITAIALLVIGLVEAYKHSKAFRDIVHEAGVIAREAFHWVLHAAMAVFDWIRQHWPLLLAILTGPVGLAVYWIVSHFDGLRHGTAAIFDAIVHFITSKFDELRHDAAHMIDDIVSFFEQMPGRVMKAIGNLGSDIWNSVTGGLGSLGSMIGLAHGGIVGAAGGGPRSGWTMVGEMGPELVRMPQGSTVFSSAQSQGMLAGGAGGSGGGGRLQLELVGGHDDLLLRWLRNAIRLQGGNVQQVLGQGTA
jgi:TP901 family phage tail tape measure protein